jgi:hypothetical protein
MGSGRHLHLQLIKFVYRRTMISNDRARRAKAPPSNRALSRSLSLSGRTGNPGIDERWAEQLRIPADRPFLIEMIAKKAHCNA